MPRRSPIDGAVAWQAALERNCEPAPALAGPDDLAVMPYTSGTTGAPKGCMHTHRSVMHTTIGGPEWCFVPKDCMVLAALPMFHVTGLQNGVMSPIYGGVSIAIMTRWDKRCAAMLIERFRVTTWTAIPTMLFDFLNQPDLDQRDLSSLHCLTGGGAAMPKAVAERIHALWGIHYIEGYGLSETMAPTHLNPTHRPKPQCLGLPIFDVHAAVIDIETLQPLRCGRSRRNRRQRPAGLPGLPRRCRAHGSRFHRDRRRALSSAPAISATSTRKAISSWSIASSA